MDGFVIDGIKQTKKGRYALFCGGEFLFSVDEQTFCEFSLYKGCHLDDGTLRELKQRSDAGKAREKALRLLGVREHSESELFKKLCRTYDDDTARHAVDEVREYGYLDDGEFARRCLETVFEPKSFSIRAARAYLDEKGVDRDIASQVLADFAAGESERLGELLAQRLAKKAELTRKDVDSACAALVRKGFSASEVRKAARAYACEKEERYTEDYSD